MLILVYKINSERLRKAKWNLTLPLKEARENEEVVALSDSQLVTFINTINGVKKDTKEEVSELRSKIRELRKLEDSAANRRKVKNTYDKIDQIMFQKDYILLVVDKVKDYRRVAASGFIVNGNKYVRLLGTSGGVKASTIVFVSERIIDDLVRLIDNGRNLDKELVPAKLEAYKSLVCSGSDPVSMPKGVAVVKDCVTVFKSTVESISDETEGEPVIELVKDATIELEESDGYGLMLPSLATRWSEELGLEYMSCGFNTRFSFEKGMVFAFDFLEFADEVAKTRTIVDVWGNEVDLSNVELILTESMVKLWDSYDSVEDYIENSVSNGYTFRISKKCPEKLESERRLNYQFIQSYDLDHEQIEELIQPTIDEIHDILGGDWKKTALFLGKGDFKVIRGEFAEAIAINPDVMNDPFIRRKIMFLIKNRISKAKAGVINVHGNYSVISGDPYSLCQSIFGLEVTGLLKAGEVYNKYWLDAGVDTLACFRAPMTSHSNIRKVKVHKSEEAQHWYRYMNTCTLLNSWDTMTHALNGADKDGDLVLLTDNRVLIDNLIDLPAISCIQRRAKKKHVTEEDLIQSNIDSFGNDVGKTTNYITSMFEVRSRFPKDSEEYEVLTYRIKCGQLFQQNAIDKAKGIVAKKMPAEWFNINKALRGNGNRAFNAKIVADKKPYFFKYIYPAVMKDFSKYDRNTRTKCIREFRITIDELKKIPVDKLTDYQKDFLADYDKNMPVGTGDYVMNRICKRFEEEFDGYISKTTPSFVFDHSEFRSDVEYTQRQYNAVEKLYKEYQSRTKDYHQMFSDILVDESEYNKRLGLLRQDYISQAEKICSNEEQLCNITLDLCYQKENHKQFAWDVSGEVIIRNMLNKHDNMIYVPIEDVDGDTTYGGESFSFIKKKLEVD